MKLLILPVKGDNDTKRGNVKKTKKPTTRLLPISETDTIQRTTHFEPKTNSGNVT